MWKKDTTLENTTRYYWTNKKKVQIKKCNEKEWIDVYNNYGTHYNSNDEENIKFAFSDDLPNTINSTFIGELVEETNKEKIPNGTYRYEIGGYGQLPHLEKFELRDDKIIETSYYKQLEKDMLSFIKNEKIYNDHGIFFKRGYLLYGKPGDGKTCIIRKLMKNLFLDNALIIYCNNVPETSLINILNKEEKDRIKIFIFEDFQNIVNDRGIEKVLNFLDGEDSIHKMIIIGTTNYPEELPGNIVDRPSRFDYLIEFKNPSAKEIKDLYKNFSGEDLLDENVNKLTSFSIAAIKEICLTTIINKITIDDAIKTLQDRSQKISKSFAKEDLKEFIL